MLGLRVSKISFYQPSNMHFDNKHTKRMAHNMNGDANFTNGLDKESVMHFDKKML